MLDPVGDGALRKMLPIHVPQIHQTRGCRGSHAPGQPGQGWQEQREGVVAALLLEKPPQNEGIKPFLEGKPHEEQLRALGLFSWRRLSGDSSQLQLLVRGRAGAGTELCSV